VKLHVVERWRIADDGKIMEAIFTVDDPDAFYQPWWGMRRYRRVEREITEDIAVLSGRWDRVSLADLEWLPARALHN
jgi:hypothetical protein